MNKEQLLQKRDEIKNKLWTIEHKLRNMAYVSSVDFASMYPSIIRLLNASIESLVGFLDDDPIAYRELGSSKIIRDSKDISKELVKTDLKDTDYVKFVGKAEEKISLRKDIYQGKYDTATIEEITETPFERYFLACVGVFDPNEVIIKFQGKNYTVTELNNYFKKMNYSVSGAGSVFKRSVTDGKEELGLIPSYLAFLFFERKAVKKSMAKNYKHKILLQKFKMAAEADGLF